MTTIFAAVVTVVLIASSMMPQQATGQTWRLIFADEFDVDGPINASSWDFEQGYIRNGEAQYYTNRTENVYVKDGVLHIKAFHEQFPIPVQPNGATVAQYTSGSVQSKQGFTYGRFEWRAKVPARGNGSWPALWLLGADIDKVGWPWCGEIDVMEAVGFDPDVLHGTFHTEAANSLRNNQVTAVVPIANMSTRFVNYSVIWTPELLTIYQEGQPYVSYANDHKCTAISWPYFRPFNAKMNLAIGGSWGGMFGIDNSYFPMEMEVDYFRVYEQVDPSFNPNDGIGCSVYNHFMEFSVDAKLVTRDTLRTNLLSAGSLMKILNTQLIVGLTTALQLPSSVGVGIHSVGLRPPGVPGSGNTLLVNFTLVDMPPSPQLTQKFNEAVANSSQWILPAIFTLETATATGAFALASLSSDCAGCYLAELGNPSQPSTVPVPQPWRSFTIPGEIFAVEYDFGGPSVAYEDTDVWNAFGKDMMRTLPDWVDITVAASTSSSNDAAAGNGLLVGYIFSNEWLRFSHVTVASDGEYAVSLSAANGAKGVTGQLLIDFAPMPNAGNSSSGSTALDPNLPTVAGNATAARVTLSVQPTGSWTSPQPSASAHVFLRGGVYLMTWYFPSPSYNIQSISFAPVPATPVPQPTTPSPGKAGNGNTVPRSTTYAIIGALCGFCAVCVGGVVWYQRRREDKTDYQLV